MFQLTEDAQHARSVERLTIRSPQQRAKVGSNAPAFDHPQLSPTWGQPSSAA